MFLFPRNLGTSENHAKIIIQWSGDCLLRSLNYVFADLFPPEKHENPLPPQPPEIQEPWDQAQMIERKILFRIALTRALYDQIRP